MKQDVKTTADYPKQLDQATCPECNIDDPNKVKKTLDKNGVWRRTWICLNLEHHRNGQARKFVFRHELDDNFEDVYLRSHTLRRFMDKVDHTVMADKETFSVIEHLTDRQMATYGKIFWWNGFDRDDIRSIVSVFASCFTGLGLKKEPKRDYYYLMMNFVDQRMEFFTECVIRKFQVNDVACYNVLSSQANSADSDNVDAPLDIIASLDQIAQFTSGATAEPEQSYHERAEELEDKVEILKIQHTDAVESGRPPEEIEAYRRAVDRLTNVAQSYRQEANKETKRERTLTANLKKKLAEDPQKYADQLSYYATYKGIPYDVRRAAKIVCRRHSIDFVSWVKTHVKATNSDESYFDLR